MNPAGVPPDVYASGAGQLAHEGILGVFCLLLIGACVFLTWRLLKSYDARVADAQSIGRDATSALEKNTAALDTLTSAIERGDHR